ncbi:heavy metal transporter [Streptomyces cyaneochromogenes]|uniref:Heavy metal transporter n=1 Tax=Streptomyces cyaneochromogenes TaxID=2496836 RepID=A0A3Q9ER33_9ACTN|nr:heavy metal transporter [Streptomyces cyaneochromogenes]AZQ37215.1 heavy metal transporter [Streptomyces cyaneochromogenes]
MPKSSASPKRRGRLLRRGAAFVVLLAVAGYLAVQYVTGGAGAPGCAVVSDKSDGARYEFTPEQAVNAATIAAVGTGRGLPERAVTIALATALQESGLRNITHGDRDSLGLFQQRPSQGWGTEKEIQDPIYSAGIFYEHLVKVRGYTELPLTVAAQRVQRSGFPEAYAKHEPDATLLAAALTGRAAATLTCEGLPGGPPAGGTDSVRAALVRDFGQDALQSAAAEVGVAEVGAAKATPAPSPSVIESDGRTVVLPVTGDKGSGAGRGVRERGWQLAHWAVANASDLHIQRVSYAGREWTAGNTDSQWRAIAGQGASGAGSGLDAVRIVTTH